MIKEVIRHCDTCDGYGFSIYSEKCRGCDGTGFVNVSTGYPSGRQSITPAIVTKQKKRGHRGKHYRSA